MGLQKNADVPQVSIFPALWGHRQTSEATSKLTAVSADDSLQDRTQSAKRLTRDSTVGIKYIKDPEGPKKPVLVERTRVKAMPLPCIFTAKIIVFLALIYWIIYLVPVYLEPLEIGVTIVWFGAVLLLSMKKDYASLLIAAVAAFNFVHDFIVELPLFKYTAIHLAAEHNISLHTASISLIVLLSLEVVFLFCFLYYAAYIIQPKRMYAF